jgi:molybdopterin converting factor small subunit
MAPHIRLKLYASLRKYMPPDAETYAIKPTACVRDLVAALNIPEKEAKLIFIDGVKKKLDQRLKGGEQVGIFPPVGGG